MDQTEFCNEIVECMIEYGKLSRGEAQLLLANSNICATNSEEDLDMIWHETPYYWAMWLIHFKKNPDWHKDPKLWPPPQDYLDKWYSSK